MFIIIELYDNYESRNIFGPFKTLSEAKEQAYKFKRIDNKYIDKRHYYIINLDDYEEI